MSAPTQGSGAQRHSSFSINQYTSELDEVQNSINENFGIGRPPARSNSRSNARDSVFSDFDESDQASGYYGNGINNNGGKPVGVVSPQVTSFRDAFRVLPTDGVDKSHLKPTMISAKTRNYNEVRVERCLNRNLWLYFNRLSRLLIGISYVVRIIIELCYMFLPSSRINFTQ